MHVRVHTKSGQRSVEKEKKNKAGSGQLKKRSSPCNQATHLKQHHTTMCVHTCLHVRVLGGGVHMCGDTHTCVYVCVYVCVGTYMLGHICGGHMSGQVGKGLYFTDSVSDRIRLPQHHSTMCTHTP